MSHGNRRIPAAIAAVFVCRLIVSLCVIPPWQQPDEHAHVAVAEVWRSTFTGLHPDDPGREREILQSMAAHRWWEHYTGRPPDVQAPTRFVNAGAVAASIGIDPRGGFLLPFYAVVGGALSLLPVMPVVVDLHLMRLLSALLALATVWVAWRASREALGDTGGTVVALLLALHPQFVLTSAAAGPDAFVNFAGAVAWWQAIRAWRGVQPARSLLIMTIAATWAALVDRGGIPVLAAAVLVLLVTTARVAGRKGAIALLAGVAAVAAAAVLIPAERDPMRDAVFGTFAGPMMPVEAARNWEYFWRFTGAFFRGWWLTLGWARYVPPTWWLLAAAIISVATATGAARRFVTDRALRPLLLLAVAFVATQVAAEYWTYFRVAHGPAGRHLLPFVVPSLTLLWLGAAELVPAAWRSQAAAALVLTVAALDSSAWLLLALPVYAS